MKSIRHTAQQIFRKHKSAEQLIAQGKTVADVCRVIELSQPTYHRWRPQYGGMQAEEAKRLTQLEKEIARLNTLRQKPIWKRPYSKIFSRETSEPGTLSQGRHGPAGALPSF